jgi:hypothetical protein
MGIIAVATVLHLGTAFSNPGVITVASHRPSVTRPPSSKGDASTATRVRGDSSMRPGAAQLPGSEGGLRCAASGRVSAPAAGTASNGGADDAVVVFRLTGAQPIDPASTGPAAAAWAVTYALATAAASSRLAAAAIVATSTPRRIGVVVQCGSHCDAAAVREGLRAVLAAPAWPRATLLGLAFGSAIPAGGAKVVLYEDGRACTRGPIIAVASPLYAATPSTLFGGSSTMAQRVRTLTWRLFARRPGERDEDAADAIARHAEQRARKSFHDHGALRAVGVIASAADAARSEPSAPAWFTAGTAVAATDAQREVARGIQWLAEHVDASTFSRFSLARIETSAQEASARDVAATGRVEIGTPSKLANVFRDLTRTDVLILPAGTVFGAVAALSLAPGSAVIELNTPASKPLQTADIFALADVSATTLLLPGGGDPNGFAACAASLDVCPRDANGTSLRLKRYEPSGNSEGPSPVADTGRNGRGASVDARWYHAFKTAVGTVWLWRSRIRDIHAFDTRR